LSKKGSYIAQVCPPTFCSFNNPIRNLIFKNNTQIINMNVADDFDVESKIAYFVTQNSPNMANKTKIVFEDKSEDRICLQNKEFLVITNKNAASLLEKVLQNDKFNVEGVGAPFRSDSMSNMSLKKNKVFRYINFHTNTENYFSKLPHPLNKLHKVILNKTGTWNPFYSFDGGFTHINFAILVNTKMEGRNLESYLASKLIRFYILQMNLFGARDKFTIDSIPYIDISRSWTDQEIYEYFNLTKEEIELIENTIKN